MIPVAATVPSVRALEFQFSHQIHYGLFLGPLSVLGHLERLWSGSEPAADVTPLQTTGWSPTSSLGNRPALSAH